VKKTASLVLAFSIAFGAFAGTAAASTPLEEAVDGLIGIDYKYGGTTTKGFDCSGFTSYVFEKFGIELPRTSKEQATVGTKVSKSELKPGDLVFFNTNGKGISHVGIYLGDGKFAQASSKHGVNITELESSYYKNKYVTARRVLDEDVFQKIAVKQPAAVQPVAEQPAVEQPTKEEILEVAAFTEAAELAEEEAGTPVEPEVVAETLKQALHSQL